MSTDTGDFGSGATSFGAVSPRFLVARRPKSGVGAGIGAGIGAVSLLVAFAGAVVLRVAFAGSEGARSVSGSLTFASVLALLAVGCRARPQLSPRIVAIGVGVAAVLVVPAMLHLGIRASLPVGTFPAWAVLTTFVAGAEEAFLRGALFDAVQRRRGADAAVVVAAIAFAAMHVPFYGWHSVPLDLTVGLVLGATRLLAGTWTAPAIAHIGADFAGWWML